MASQTDLATAAGARVDATSVGFTNPTSFEVFIFGLTALSIVNIGLLLLPLSNAQHSVIKITDGVLCFFFIADFLVRYRKSADRRRYFFRDWGWLDLIGSLPAPGLRLLRAFRMWRIALGLKRLGGDAVYRRALPAPAPPDGVFHLPPRTHVLVGQAAVAGERRAHPHGRHLGARVERVGVRVAHCGLRRGLRRGKGGEGGGARRQQDRRQARSDARTDARIGHGLLVGSNGERRPSRAADFDRVRPGAREPSGARRSTVRRRRPGVDAPAARRRSRRWAAVSLEWPRRQPEARQR